jgi:hypothetical protein
MPDQNPNDFTDREKLLLSYYRVADASLSRRTWLYDGAIGIASLVCLLMSISREDMALGLVAYALVVGRWFYLVVEGGRWNQDFRSIFAKYDARLRELTEKQQPKEREQ